MTSSKRERFQSDLTIDDDAVDELVAADDLAAEFDENLDDGTLAAKYRRLATEQAALRRIATLVARGVEPFEVFGAVAEEMRRYVPADTAGLWRYGSGREITVVAAAADPEALAIWPVGTRTPVEGNTIATLVQRTGQTARMDSYENVAGPTAARVRAVSVSAAVGVPIIVDGRVWGLAAVGFVQHSPMPADTEVLINRFAELIATAVVAGYRDEQKRQLLAEASQRSSLVDVLLEGRAFGDWNLRDLPPSFGCRSMVLLWSSPPTFRVPAENRYPRSNRNYAASIYFQHGGCSLTCRKGSCTSPANENSAWLLPCCHG